MCSCSGSCNCNSTTIPKGPAGPVGPQGIKGDKGVDGINGLAGTDGINAYTTLTEGFVQPFINSPVDARVVNNSWVTIDQIIYIPFGGYYRVANITNTPGNITIQLINLGWSIPGVTFATNGQFVGTAGTVVSSSGTIGARGAAGQSTNGIDGVNAFTTVIGAGYFQPGATATLIPVANNSWIGISQIIFISSTTGGNIGGFYRVESKIGLNSITATKLDWTIPGVTFAAIGDPIPAGSIVSASGSKGADGTTAALSYVVDAQWGVFTSYAAFNSGNGEKLTSIGVNANTLLSNSDVLEGQTVYRLNENTLSSNTYYIRVSPSNNDVGTVVVFTDYLPLSGVDEGNYMYIYMNYKIQKTSFTTFRCIAEISYTPEEPPSPGNIKFSEIPHKFMSITTSDLSLSGSTTWGQPQYIVAGAYDINSASALMYSVAAIHHEVKATRKN
jgi:hypothetical protein